MSNLDLKKIKSIPALIDESSKENSKNNNSLEDEKSENLEVLEELKEIRVENLNDDVLELDKENKNNIDNSYSGGSSNNESIKNIYQLISNYSFLDNQIVYIDALKNSVNKNYVTFTQRSAISNDSYFVIFLKTQVPKIYKNMVGLIFIDNYDEMLESVEDFKRPLLLAIVERKIKTMAKELGAIVKSFEKDKYLFIASQDKLDKMKDNKFSILDSVQEIDMGNTIPVTLSIGIGIEGDDFDENMEFARISIDLALSRGGAQVIIKNKDNYQFFGGNAKETSKNTRVRARVKAYSFSELIENASDVIVMGHKNIDLDCLGAGLGVHAIVTAFHKNCKIVLNNVTTSVSTLYNKLEKDNYYEDVFISSEQAMRSIGKKTLLVVVDTYKDTICECTELVGLANKIVVFDHHRKGAEYIDNAVLVYHESLASSTCELIAEMLIYINRLINLRPVVADAMLAGIIVDTKNFAFKTGIKTFEVAAYLKKKGADTIRVKKLFRNDLDFYIVKANVISNMEIYKEHIAMSVLHVEVDNPVLLIAQACDELLNINNIECGFVICQDKDVIHISARSFGDINTQLIMEKLGGGGHQAISATQLKNIEINKAKQMLKMALDEYFEEMSS